jgi:hypothetical protein
VPITAESDICKLPMGGRFAIHDLYESYKPLNLSTVEILTPDRDVQADDLYLIIRAMSVTKATGE